MATVTKVVVVLALSQALMAGFTTGFPNTIPLKMEEPTFSRINRRLLEYKTTKASPVCSQHDQHVCTEDEFCDPNSRYCRSCESFCRSSYNLKPREGSQSKCKVFCPEYYRQLQAKPQVTTVTAAAVFGSTQSPWVYLQRATNITTLAFLFMFLIAVVVIGVKCYPLLKQHLVRMKRSQYYQVPSEENPDETLTSASTNKGNVIVDISQATSVPPGLPSTLSDTENSGMDEAIPLHNLCDTSTSTALTSSGQVTTSADVHSLPQSDGTAVRKEDETREFDNLAGSAVESNDSGNYLGSSFGGD